MTPEEANEVWDVLVEHAGAVEEGRSEFVFHLASDHRTATDEFRFCGTLGRGGKFRRNYTRGDRIYPTAEENLICGMVEAWWGEIWYVDCYKEDETPERLATIEATNAALAPINLRFQWRTAKYVGEGENA